MKVLFQMMCGMLMLASCNEVKPPIAPAVTVGAWSDPKTWGNGVVPSDGANVSIPSTASIVLDQNINLGNLEILGSLEVKDQDVTLNAKNIMVHGTFRIGSALKPFEHKAVMTLNASDTLENNMGMGTRGILVMGGKLELYGKSPNYAWTKLIDHAADNSSKLNLVDAVNWKTGDQIVVAPTDFYNDGNFTKTSETEQLEISSVTGGMVQLKTPLAKARWGKLQYATDSGMSLTPGTLSKPDPSLPSILDERAEVGNLTRNIVIQSADDDLWKTQGFGAHVMVMDKNSSVTIDGVELRRMGQSGVFGRYPIHFHNLSYDSLGKNLGDASNMLLQNSSIHDTAQRCVVIHGSNGVTIKNNICYDIKGHAMFLEDAVERRNTFEHNLILKIRRPVKPLLKSEEPDHEGGNASGFWLTNPDNIVRGNVVADGISHGYWLAYPTKVMGVNKNVNLNGINARPDNLPFGVFEDNTAHSVSDNGVHIDNPPTSSDIGDTAGNKYIPTINGAIDDYQEQHRLRFSLARVTVYKAGSYWGGGGGIWNRNSNPDFLEWISADHQGGWFAGAGDRGLITKSLLIGASLNNATPITHDLPKAAIASYHSTFDITKNVIMNFPFIENASNDPSGAFKTNDYYITAVDKGLVRNPDNKLINASPGRRVQPFLNEHWTLAGALWDPHGYWGTKGNYWVYDDPFLTTDTSCVDVMPTGKNGKSCAGPFYGIGDYLTDFDANRYLFKAPIEVTRYNNANSSIGTWTVGDGNTAPKLGNMRHFAAFKDGRYALRFPGHDKPKDVSLTLSNFIRSDDSMILGVAFDGALNATAFIGGRSATRTWDLTNPQPFHSEARFMAAGADLNAVINDVNGKTFWQDKVNNIVWTKIKGGLYPINPNLDPTSDEALYHNMEFVVCEKSAVPTKVCQNPLPQ
jgi:G8 domain/Right handed beta helix region